ncbi:MAG: hypothetical protein M1820_005108 [Bogoriella megaspora]|nr:MAG: hypothetical protein M1820_005108 [Bogoriella megaspora]
MPGLVRKLAIYAAIDGLILQPISQRNSAATAASSICIDYNSHAISPVLHEWPEGRGNQVSLEAHGIVGLLSIASRAYLISISRRKQVAQIQGKPIYVIQDVALIPLTSQSEAKIAISEARDKLRQYIEEESLEATAENDFLADDGGSSHGGDDASLTSPTIVNPGDDNKDEGDKTHKRTTSVVEDVISKRGAYGRFADKWFSKGGWSTDKRRTLGMSSEDDLTKPKANAKPVEEPKSSGERTAKAVNATTADAIEIQDSEFPQQSEHAVLEEDFSVPLLSKMLRTTRLLLNSRSFFYSYDYDLSHSFTKQPNAGSAAPLFKQFDRIFFWNRHLSTPLVDAGHQNFVLPLLQGFVGQRTFTLQKQSSTGQDAVVDALHNTDEAVIAQAPQARKLKTPVEEITPEGVGAVATQNFVLTLISRRSTERAGLRYLRRGVDDSGHAANSIETEQMLSLSSWGPEEKICSFVQCRGSIPLFFSQSPYSFKPVPVFYGTPSANQAAFRQHFATLMSRYGNVQAVSLVDKHGTENRIGEEYEKHANTFNDDGGVDGKSIGFTWFDFHNICRGMRFENVSVLIQEIGSRLSEYGWTVVQNDTTTKEQGGILRTNCMDCLDRTNVVQSAAARWALEKQLADHGFMVDLQNDPTTSWFNQVWADNGDAISRQYAGTAALKGDYTRTRKRNITGALNDFSLTLNRYYNNIFGDYFTQACIDFLLGRTTESVFEDFEEDMKSKDLAMDMSKVRQSAIETCRKIVIEDLSEDLEAGWTLLAPHDANTLRSVPFEECVLLLTNAGLYLCRFDWSIEKVSEYTKIDLQNVTAIQKGSYVTSTFTAKQRDETRNFGFIIKYHAPSGRDLRRINTRSLENEKPVNGKPVGDGQIARDAPDSNAALSQTPQNSKTSTQLEQTRLLAFKVLSPRSSAVSSGAGRELEHQDEKELVYTICEEILRAATNAKTFNAGEQAPKSEQVQVEEKAIISLADARKSTTYLESIGHSIKRLVWA